MTNTSGLTQAAYDALIAMAGTDNSWPVAGTGEPDNTARKGYAAYLRHVQEGLCPQCGDALGSEPVEIAHIVGGTAVRRGWIGSNLTLAHSACNDTDQSLGVNVPLASIVRPELVATVRPARAELLEWATRIVPNTVQDERNARRMARMA